MTPDPGGPNLWAYLSLEEIKDLIKFSAGELCRVYDLKSREPQKRFHYNAALEAEIKLCEAAHDSHWSWFRERSSETPQLRAQS